MEKITADDYKLDDQQIGAAEGSEDRIEDKVHDESPAHPRPDIDEDFDENEGVDRDEGGENAENEQGGERGKPAPRFVEENLWKTEIVEEYPEGFPRAAAFINADSTYAIYRRFSRGRTRIILHLQAELMMLEKKLDLYDKEVAENNDVEWTLHQSRFHPQQVAAPASQEFLKKQIQCFGRFKDVLKLYDDAIIRESILRKLPPPSPHARNNVGRHFYQESPFVEGENDHMTYVEDLITTGKGEKDSWLEGSISSSLGSKPLRIFKKYFLSPEHRHKTKNNEYGESKFVHYVCSKRLGTMADIVMIFVVFMLSLLPLYTFFSVNLSIIIIALISNLFSVYLLSSYTAVKRPQLYIIAMSQSSFLVLGALLAQMSNKLSFSALNKWL